MAATFKYGVTTTTLHPVIGAYSGYGYEDELTVQKLLGKDPARADKNEVLQSSGLGARSATIELYATLVEKDYLESLLWKSVVHDDGLGGTPKLVVITKCQATLYHKAGAGAAVYKLMVSCREFNPSLIVPSSYGLLAWYKADALLGTYADDARINAWPDSSGNGHDLTYDTINQVPKFKTGIVSGAMPVGRNATAGHYLKTTHIGATLGTVIGVAGNCSNGASAPAWARDDAGTHPRIVTYYDNNRGLFVGNTDDVMSPVGGQVLERYVDEQSIAWADTSGAQGLPDTGFHVISESPQHDQGAKTMDGTRTLFFYGNASFLGDIAEVLFFSTKLNGSQRTFVERYLAGKYGL